MKMKIYEKALDVFKKKVRLLRIHKIKEEDILSSFIVNLNEAFTDIKYYFVKLKTGESALYLLPNFEFLAGKKILNKNMFEELPKKEFKDKDEAINGDISGILFLDLYGEYKNNRREKFFGTPYSYAFNYLSSHYYNVNKYFEPYYNDLYNKVKNECENLGITYETEPKKILEEKLKIVKENDKFNLFDITICKSKELLEEYYKNIISKCNDRKKFDFELTDFSYLKFDYITSVPGEFLTQARNLFLALDDKNFPNRESILKNYMEFFIAKDYIFEIEKHMNNLLKNGMNIQIKKDLERFNSNKQFMEDLKTAIEHDTTKEIYRYHATTSEHSAKQILEEGFYMYSSELDTTSCQEFNKEEILNYAYGNGIEYFGDYIVIIRVPINENIVKEVPKEEYEKLQIYPRRIGMASQKPKWKIDKKHVVAIVDKEHEKIIFNPEYQNNNKKQL